MTERVPEELQEEREALVNAVLLFEALVADQAGDVGLTECEEIAAERERDTLRVLRRMLEAWNRRAAACVTEGER
jgi:hypothetical protein